MLTRGSPGHGVLKTACDVPLWRGSPKKCTHTNRRSLYEMFCGALPIAARVLSILTKAKMVPIMVLSRNLPRSPSESGRSQSIAALFRTGSETAHSVTGFRGGRIG